MLKAYFLAAPKVLKQLVFGVDTIIGLWVYMVLGIAFWMPPSLICLALAIFFAYLPDLDLIPFFLLKKRLRLVSHWAVGHYPLWVTAISTLAVYLVASRVVPGSVLFLCTLCVTCIVSHFFHDSVQPHGIAWLGPWPSTRFVFRGGRLVAADPEKWRERLAFLSQGATMRNSLEETLMRLESGQVSLVRIKWWIVPVLVISIYWICRFAIG